MKKVLFVGENPLGITGNSKMLRGLLSNLDTEEYTPSCFCVNVGPVDPVRSMFNPFPFHVVENDQWDESWGAERLLDILRRVEELDFLVMVGIDLWRYSKYYPKIQEIARQRDFKFIHIFPYDIQDPRPDWIEWINNIDFPCVYSKYGYDMLKDYVPNLTYFRPRFQIPEMWKTPTPEERFKARSSMFPELCDHDFVFGFIGPNQHRKDPLGIIEAFSIVKKDNPNCYLYMHTEQNGAFNLVQYAEDCGLQTQDLLMKRPGAFFKAGDMPSVYAAIDCFVNCSLQEGLSWTTLEAMLCSIPVIASNSTAHTELLSDAGILVECSIPIHMPLQGKRGKASIKAKRCDPRLMAQAMSIMLDSESKVRETIAIMCKDKAESWLEDVSDINVLLRDVSERIPEQEKQSESKNAVLFAQHSAGGDVLMTTRCLKDLKERHPDLELHYMTQPQYMDIVSGHPYIDELVPWNEDLLKTYKYVYNPHGDRILPGWWGRNSNSILADFYWKILEIDQPDDFYINKTPPKGIDFIMGVPSKSICVVHTTGGDASFRTYKYMEDVCKGLKDRYLTIQVGGKNDYPAGAVHDFRGLTFSEMAWIVSKASLAITVDSHVSHLSGALGVSQVALFGSGNAAVCRPVQVKGELICLSIDYVKDCPGLGPCSAAVRDCAVPCTGLHNPKTILESVNEIIRRERNFSSLMG